MPQEPVGKLGASLLVLLTIIASAACEPGSEARFRTEVLPGGAVNVTNTGAPAWTSGAGWRLEEDLRLGTVAGEGPEQFSRITAVLADSAGMIYVLDLFVQEIRVFHPSGAFSHTIGSMGGGPGELLGAEGMIFGPDGTLWVMDPMAARYTSFDLDGTFLTSHARRVRGCPLAGGFTPEGDLLDCATAFPDEGPGVIAGARLVFYPVRMSNDFQRGDTLPPFEYTQEMITRLDGVSIPQVFFKGGFEAFLDQSGQISFADSREYRIFRRTLDGDTTLIFSLPAEPAPIGEVEREEVRAGYRARPDLLPVYLEHLPRAKPIIRRILSDGAGHILVIPELAGAPAGTVMDVFRDNGEYLGRLELPEPISSVGLAGGSLSPVYATEDHLYCVIADELDVPFLSRLRIRRGDGEH